MMKLGRFFQIALLLLIAAGAQPAYSAFYQWSKTASSNATADPSINWAEGMSPSSVNDSARAMMARAAEYRDDISGLLAAGGTGTPYTVTTNQGLTNPPSDGQLLAFIANVDNPVNPSIQTDGGGSYAIISNAGVPLAAGSMVGGRVYTFRFTTSTNQWLVRDQFSQSTTNNIPLGALIPYTGTSAPSANFIFPAGQCISTVTYASYWALVGSPPSGGCPGGQFAVVDLRGRAPVGLDNLGGGAANRLTSSLTGCGTAMTSVGAVCANGSESQTLSTGQLPTGITSSGSNSISVTSGNSLVKNAALGVNPGSASGTAVWNGGSASAETSTNSSQSISVTSDNTSGGAHPIVQPSIGVTYILRVL